MSDDISKSYEEALELAKLQAQVASNSRAEAIYTAMLDDRVRKLSHKFLRQGYHSNGIKFPALNNFGNERLNFQFVPPAGKMALDSPFFYVTVNLKSKTVDRVVECWSGEEEEILDS